ncbi:MAG: hypothetical protein ACLQIB_29650 [Isosphaeraceae bacterium]
MNPFVLIALMLASLPGLTPGDDAKDEARASQSAAWRFVLPAPGDPFEHAPFRALVLSRNKPEDLIETAAYRGDPARRRYVQIRFGSPGSIRVTVVLDEIGSETADLYVDADRNRKIDDRDCVKGAATTGPNVRREHVWRLPLNVAMVDKDVTRMIPRAVVFRLGAGGRTLAYAAAGFLQGTVSLANREEAGRDGPNPKIVQPLAARRVDGDGNGLVTDAQDRLWIDLNGDGRFDPASEQFLYSTVLNLEGKRFIVRSDELGSRLAIEPLVGVGTLRLAIKGNTVAAKAGPGLVELHATVLGRDGSVYSASGAEPATVPVGDYRLGLVTVSLNETEGGDNRWSFLFSSNGAKGDPRWYKVEKDGTVTIDPIGTLSFEVSLSEQAGVAKLGDDISVQPLLYTGDGLLINVAYRGAPISPAAQESLGARVALAATDGQVLATAHSGFA